MRRVTSVVPGFGINQYVPVRTSVPLYRGSLGSCHTMLIIEQYGTFPPNYRAVQNGTDLSMAGIEFTRASMDFPEANL